MTPTPPKRTHASMGVTPVARGRRALLCGLTCALGAPAFLSGCTVASPHDSLLVSLIATRANAHPLAGATVSGGIYVYASGAAGITRVTFQLDGARTPVSVDSRAPWDLAGTGTSVAARPFNADALSPGLHRLVAQVRRGSSMSTVAATFTVVKTAHKPSVPSPTPSPSTSTTPTPTPTPAPAPTPTPTPTASPSPSPTPTQTPTPTPTPTPSPTAAPTSAPPTTGPLTPSSGRPWSATSPFNTVLQPNAVLAGNSASIASYLSGGTNQQIADLYDYGWPVFAADASTPKGSVKVTQNWGPDPFGGQPVPLPAKLAPNAGSDGHAIVIDYSTGRAYEFWQLKKIDATHFTASWGQMTPDVFNGVGNEQLYGGSSTGSNLSGLAGTVRSYEMRAGVINHALAFSSNAVTPGTFEFPALKTDGTNMAGLPLSMTIPEGARIRLDPTINLSAIPGITPAELIVGRALQKYGAFCVDQGAARMAFGFEDPIGDSAGNPYPGLGFGWDYYQMSHLPWSHLQVLRQWNGQ